MRSKQRTKAESPRQAVAELTERTREEVLTALRERRIVFLTNLLLRMIILFIMVVQLIHGYFENVALCALALLLFSAPRFLRKHTHAELPTGLEMVVLFFIFASLILGEISGFYVRYPYWDTILHSVNGFCSAAIGLSMLDILNRSKRFSFLCSPLYVALASFCFSMTVGVLWEFFEFFMDYFFGTDMQKATVVRSFACSTLGEGGLQQFRDIGYSVLYDESGTAIQTVVGGFLDMGLIDTMEDLLVNFVGAALFAVFGFFYVKRQGNTKIVKSFVMTYKSNPQELLAQVRQSTPDAAAPPKAEPVPSPAPESEPAAADEE